MDGRRPAYSRIVSGAASAHDAPLAIAVVGAGRADPETEGVAEQVGAGIARAGALLVTGGLGGVMAAAARGARGAGGAVLGLLPGDSRVDANPWVTIAVPTGLGELRNWLVVRAADAVVAVGGEHGTLSELALALKLGRPVVGLGTWRLERPGGGNEQAVHEAADADGAVSLVLRLAAGREDRGAADGPRVGGPPAGGTGTGAGAGAAPIDSR